VAAWHHLCRGFTQEKGAVCDSEHAVLVTQSEDCGTEGLTWEMLRSRRRPRIGWGQAGETVQVLRQALAAWWLCRPPLTCSEGTFSHGNQCVAPDPHMWLLLVICWLGQDIFLSLLNISCILSPSSGTKQKTGEQIGLSLRISGWVRSSGWITPLPRQRAAAETLSFPPLQIIPSLFLISQILGL